jgi:hypothetical protein
MKYCLVFFGLLAVTLPSAFHGWREYVAIFLVVLLTTDLFDMAMVARYRQKIGRFIQEHGAEIESVV